jgi:hypothetical protein
MSQPDLLDRLRDARPIAPTELRERVRLIAAQAPSPRRTLTWRRSLVVLVPVAAAIIAAVVILPGGGKQAESVQVPESALAAQTLTPSLAESSASQARGAAPAPEVKTSAPIPSATRIQNYSASLDLQLPTAAAVSDAARRAVAIATALSGYQQRVTIDAGGKTGYADIVLRIPVGNVREAIRRLSGLGRVTSENVSIQDLQTQVNTTDQRIARLQGRLTALRAEPQTTQTEHQITALTTRIENLQRARAATVRTAHYSTVSLQLTTPPPATPKAPRKPGPLHGLGIAFHWLWIGAVYALALGAPLLALIAAGWFLARTLRRRREERLLRLT